MNEKERAAVLEAAEDLRKAGEDPEAVLRVARNLKATGQPSRWLLETALEAETAFLNEVQRRHEARRKSARIGGPPYPDPLSELAEIAAALPGVLESPRFRQRMHRDLTRLSGFLPVDGSRRVERIKTPANQDALPPLVRHRANELSPKEKEWRRETRAAAERLGRALTKIRPFEDLEEHARKLSERIREDVAQARAQAPRGKKNAAAEAEWKAWATSLGYSSQRALERAMKCLTPKKYPMSSRPEQGKEPTLKSKRRKAHVEATHTARSSRKTPRQDRNPPDLEMERDGAQVPSHGERKSEGARPLPGGGPGRVPRGASVRKHVRGNRQPSAGRVRGPT